MGAGKGARLALPARRARDRIVAAVTIVEAEESRSCGGDLLP